MVPGGGLRGPEHRAERIIAGYGEGAGTSGPSESSRGGAGHGGRAGKIEGEERENGKAYDDRAPSRRGGPTAFRCLPDRVGGAAGRRYPARPGAHRGRRPVRLPDRRLRGGGG